MSQDKTYHLLIVDEDSTIRTNLKEYLANYHQAAYKLAITEASTAEDAIENLGKKPYDLIISDINLPDHDGFYILKHAEQLHPDIKKALITAYDIDGYIKMVKEEKVYNIIVKTAPFNFTELSAVVNNLIAPEKAFGLHNYLDAKEPFNEIELQSTEAIMEVTDKLKEFFRKFGLPDVDTLAIVMVEAITNAVYHSARNPDGSLRYKKGELIELLPPHERVKVTYGHDDEKVGVSILDQGGTMSPDEVLYWLERNISGESLMDTHGRGLYLIHRLMDRVVINIEKGKHTELILLHFINDIPQDNKPLYINQVS